MEIIIDSREQALKDLLKDDKITYENLLVGDIQIKKIHGNDHEQIVLLERKTINDLKSSLRDGRFSEQKRRISASNFINKGYIIEGNLDSEGKNFKNIIKQLIIRIQFKDKMSIFLTGSILDTVSLIKEIKRKLELDPKLYQYANNDQKYVETLHVCKKTNLTPNNCFILQLSQIPGISKKTAQIISNNYNSWSKLIQAIKDKDQFLLSVKDAKIGKKKYDTLCNYIT